MLCCNPKRSGTILLLKPPKQNYLVKHKRLNRINNASHAISAANWHECPSLGIQLPRLVPGLFWPRRQEVAGALDGGVGGTVDICRGWRARCTGNGVSRRLLVGHYPGILMKCGAVRGWGSLDGMSNAWVGRGSTHTPTPSLFPSTLLPVPSSCIPSAPKPPKCTQWDGGCPGAHAPSAGHFPGDEAEREAIRHLGTAGV